MLLRTECRVEIIRDSFILWLSRMLLSCTLLRFIINVFEYNMTEQRSKDPLHGITLEMQVNALVAKYGWIKLGQLIKINCFRNDPSVKSSLKFLRRTHWARSEVEALYLDSLEDNNVINYPEGDPWANNRHKN